MPRSDASKAPGTPRKLSWLAASGPSMEMEQRLTPASLIFCAVSGVISVPLGEKAGQALAVGIGHQLVHVGPHHGVAAGEDDDGFAHLRKGIDEGLGLFGRKLSGVGFRVGLGTAVLAGQIAGAGHFPGNEAAGGAAVFKGAQGGRDAVGVTGCGIARSAPSALSRPALGRLGHSRNGGGWALPV